MMMKYEMSEASNKMPDERDLYTYFIPLLSLLFATLMLHWYVFLYLCRNQVKSVNWRKESKIAKNRSKRRLQLKLLQMRRRKAKTAMATVTPSIIDKVPKIWRTEGWPADDWSKAGER